ncbi:MAG: cytochrome c maturation protein CcmE [bacterium]|nr:cytochrome c maturation protein CcmE [bacterium]
MNKRSIKFIAGGVLILLVALGLFSSLSSENLTYYQTPNEVLANPAKYENEKIRIMGLIEKDSVTWEPQDTRLSFRITEDSETFLSVTYIGSKPDMFKEGQGVVVEGMMVSAKEFKANTLLVKHSEEYKVDPEMMHQMKKDKYFDSLSAN